MSKPAAHRDQRQATKKHLGSNKTSTCLPMPKRNPILSPRLEGAAPSDHWKLTRELEQTPADTPEQENYQSSPHRRHTTSAALPPSLDTEKQKESCREDRRISTAEHQGQKLEAPGAAPVSAQGEIRGARRGAVSEKRNPIPLQPGSGAEPP